MHDIVSYVDPYAWLRLGFWHLRDVCSSNEYGSDLHSGSGSGNTAEKFLYDGLSAELCWQPNANLLCVRLHNRYLRR